MDTIRGHIDRIIFEAAGDYFIVLFGLDDESKTKVHLQGIPAQGYKAKGTFAGLSKLKPNVPLILHGTIKEAFQVEAWEPWVDVAGDFYLFATNLLPPFYDREWTKALQLEYGDSLPTLLDKADPRLKAFASDLDNKGLLPDTKYQTHLSKCFKVWQEMRLWSQMSLLLTKYKQKASLASTAFKVIGPNAVAILESDPYQLVKIGATFQAIDQSLIAQGGSTEDPRRYKGVIQAALQKRFTEGHTVTDLALLPYLVRDLLQSTPGVVPFGQDSATKIDTMVGEMATEGWCIQPDPLSVSIAKVGNWEVSIAKAVKARLATTVTPSDVDWPTFFEGYRATHGWDLSEAQREAVRMADASSISILTGYPGTGKTSTLKALVQLWTKRGKKVSLLTPTGISAKRLSTVTGQQAQTVHRALNYTGEEWERTSLSVDCVVLDEVGMVDTETFYHLIEAIPPSTKLVLVGDPDQLYPVGPGSVLLDLLRYPAIPRVVLTEVFRAAQESAVIRYANKIRAGEELDLASLNVGKEFRYVHATGKVGIDLIVKLALAMERKGKVQQVLSPFHNGTLGVKNLNRELQRVLNPSDPAKLEVQLAYGTFRQGDRVLFTENDYSLKVFNGDRGTLVKIGSTLEVITAEGFKVVIPAKRASDILALGYCLTVHKSQGNEFQNVILAVDSSPLASKPLFYTAVTRAKESVWVVGHQASLELGLRRPQPVRQTGLPSYLSGV